MKHPKKPHRHGVGGNPAISSQKLTLLSIRLTRQQRDKLNLLGGASWLRRQIDNAVLPTQEIDAAPQIARDQTPRYAQCQCKNVRGTQCLRKANAILKQVIDGQTYEFSVCDEHNIAFRQGTLSISGSK